MSADSKEAKEGKADKEIAKVEGDEQDERKRGWMRWALGWVVAPGSILGGIFVAGVLVGAHTSQSWFTRAIVWIGDLF